ncbi:unnamed protein product, partial [Symbiodinium sp. CCMP2592]
VSRCLPLSRRENMFQWNWGIMLLLVFAVGVDGMEAKQEPADADEHDLDDEFLAQVLSASLGDPCKVEDPASEAVVAAPDDPYLGGIDLDDLDEVIREGASPVEGTEGEDVGNGVVEAEEIAASPDNSDDGSVEMGEEVPGAPLPNPLGAFLAATEHIDVDLFATYAQNPGLWHRLITKAWKQAVRLHHPDAQGGHNQFLDLTEAKETLLAWAAEFTAVKKAWPQAHPKCFCDSCRALIQRMLLCPKCLGLKTNTGHACGAFSKQFGIFLRTAKHKATILHLAMLVAHGLSEEKAIEEVRTQLACDQEAAKTRAELESELAEQAGAAGDIPDVPPGWVAPDCPPNLALDHPGPTHVCPVCNHNSIQWEAVRMATGFLKPWLRCTRYPRCPFSYSPRRGVHRDRRHPDQRH